jgi:hypothetical protein
MADADAERSVLTSEEWKGVRSWTTSCDHLEFQRACARKISREPKRGDVIMLMSAETFPPYGVDVEECVQAYTPRVHALLAGLVGPLLEHFGDQDEEAPLLAVKGVGDALHAVGGKFAQVAVFNAILCFFPADIDAVCRGEYNRKNVRQALFNAWLGCGDWGEGFP